MADGRQHMADALAPILADLRGHGYAVETLEDLDRPGVGDDAAVQLLLDHLPGTIDVSLILKLVRPLRSSWARKAAGPAVARLLPTITDQTDPTGNVRFYLGDTLERIATDAIADRLLDLVRAPELGRGRGMVVIGLARLKKSRAKVVPVLLDLVDDPDVDIYAAVALGKLKVTEAREGIERLTHDEEPWVRQKAKQALTKLPSE